MVIEMFLCYLDLQVFGDGSGWEIFKKLMEKLGVFKVFEDIQNVVGVLVKFIYVILNLYDVIVFNVISQLLDFYMKVR